MLALFRALLTILLPAAGGRNIAADLTEIGVTAAALALIYDNYWAFYSSGALVSALDNICSHMKLADAPAKRLREYLKSSSYNRNVKDQAQTVELQTDVELRPDFRFTCNLSIGEFPMVPIYFHSTRS